MTFHFTDPTGDHVEIRPMLLATPRGPVPAASVDPDGTWFYVGADQAEEFIAGLRDTVRNAATAAAAQGVPSPAPAPSAEQEQAATDRAEALLAPIEAKVREHLALDRAKHRNDVLRQAADAVFALDYDVMVGEKGDEDLGSMREAWDLGTIHAMELLRRMAGEQLADAEQPPAAVEPSAQPRLFHLQRDHDVSGVSGTGRVANGVLWPDGTVSLRWIGDRPSTVSWDRLADAEHVHGHGGATRIVWADEQQAAAPSTNTSISPTAVLLATRCDTCQHTLNWHRNDVGCTVALCVCGRFQPPADEVQQS